MCLVKQPKHLGSREKPSSSTCRFVSVFHPHQTLNFHPGYLCTHAAQILFDRYLVSFWVLGTRTHSGYQPAWEEPSHNLYPLACDFHGHFCGMSLAPSKAKEEAWESSALQQFEEQQREQQELEEQ